MLSKTIHEPAYVISKAGSRHIYEIVRGNRCHKDSSECNIALTLQINVFG